MKNYSNNIEKVQSLLKKYDNIVIGAGAGLSTSAGLTYSGKRFSDNFPDFIEKYGLSDMYSSAFYNFKTDEEKWAYFSRHIMLNRYTDLKTDTYKNLLNLVKDKNFFVITTNVDMLFARNNFKNIFHTQGDYGVFQCSKPCKNELFDNKESVFSMVNEQKDMKIPKNLIPRCPFCNEKLTVNLRMDSTFVQDETWYENAKKYSEFLQNNDDILFLELGVGYNTPSIIKYPFWQMTYKNENSYYISINLDDDYIPEEISHKSIILNGDISEILEKLSI